MAQCKKKRHSLSQLIGEPEPHLDNPANNDVSELGSIPAEKPVFYPSRAPDR